MNCSFLLIFGILVSVVFISTGSIDLDWQLVSYRYSEWHRSVDYWEYCPSIKINWWIAYVINVLRIAVGCLVLVFCLDELKWRLKR